MQPYNDHTVKTRLLLRPIYSKIGTIRFAGINQGGVGIAMPPNPPRKLSCYTFTLILNGRGFYRHPDNQLSELSRGDIALSFPNIPHGYGTRDNETWDELWFEFEGPVFDLLFQKGLLQHKQPVYNTHSCDACFKRIFQIIPPIHLSRNTNAEVIVSNFLCALVEILAGHDSSSSPNDHDEEWVTKASLMLETPEDGQMPAPAAIAQKLGMSHETFRKNFRTQTGFSPGQFQLETRMNRAAALLHQGRLQIREISAVLGFCDEFHFSRTFKRRFGVSPRDFRKRVHGQ